MDSNFSASPEWSVSYSPAQNGFASGPTGLFAPFGDKESMMSNDGVYGLFDERDSNSYLQSTPPSATPLRRARSSSALPHIAPGSSIYPFHDPTSPSSPLSETIQTPRDGHQVQSGSWFAAEQSAYLNSLPGSTAPLQQPQQQQGNTSSPPLFANQLATPASDGTLRQRRRFPSAQPALPSQASEMGSRQGSYQGNSGDLSINISSAGSIPMVQQPSIEDVNQFFTEMNEILGPAAMSAISPPAGYPENATSPSYARPSTGGAPTYQVNGVILDAEDYALYSRSPSNFQGQWAQSAPPTQTSFNPYDTRPIQHRGQRRSPPPFADQHPQQRQQQGQFGFNPDYSTTSTPTSAFAPGFVPPPRPRSAPASPDLGSGAFAPFGLEGSFQPQYQAPSGSYALRRGSSADAMPRTFPQNGPMDQQYPAPQPPPPHHFQQQTPPQYRQQQPPYYSAPTAHQLYGRPSYGGEPPSPSPIHPPPLRRMSSVPAGLAVNPRPMVPLKKPTGKGKRGKADGGFSFINFTSSDATKLLGGVAPSGSSKRKREEEIAAEERRASKKKVTAA
ncbi:hypothetical protein BCR35DRAFT_353748 [Leucosporidium creatinivorum]|uniref:Developmental regulatory protein wetA n=1 Tax=Leucosporidium creatinivorum TaxID=106004 RepID=A0A1Y2EV85_9BASI|nr:hypothetical protein BCR35DRAFT_353748 [Leucosporidium creatinivorum]